MLVAVVPRLDFLLLFTVEPNSNVFRRNHFKRNQVFVLVQNKILDAGPALVAVVVILSFIGLVLSPLLYPLEVGLCLQARLLVLFLVRVGEGAL